MSGRKSIRYLVGFLITIGLIILLISLLFGGGNDKKVPKTSKTLDSYASTDAVATLTAAGPINYQGDHREVRISVSRDQVLYEVQRGYNGEIIKQQNWGNTQEAYRAFLAALETANFTKGDTKAAIKDPTGLCPLDKRYILTLTEGGNDIIRFWSTTCGAKTFQGKLSTVKELFRTQLPANSNLLTTDNVNYL